MDRNLLVLELVRAQIKRLLYGFIVSDLLSSLSQKSHFVFEMVQLCVILLINASFDHRVNILYEVLTMLVRVFADLSGDGIGQDSKHLVHNLLTKDVAISTTLIPVPLAPFLDCRNKFFSEWSFEKSGFVSNRASIDVDLFLELL